LQSQVSSSLMVGSKHNIASTRVIIQRPEKLKKNNFTPQHSNQQVFTSTHTEKTVGQYCDPEKLNFGIPLDLVTLTVCLYVLCIGILV